MRITQKHIQYLLLLLIVVIGFCAYQFGYVKFVEEANKVKTENKAIEARIDELTDKETHRSEWSDAIAKTDDNIKELLAKYGPGNTPQKTIVFAKDLEEAADMEISSLSFNPDVAIYVSEDTDEEGNPRVEMDSSYISLNYSTNYDGLKKCMDYITGYPERMNVTGFTASVNQEDGKIAGNMIINLYGVKDANHEYVDPVITDVTLGVNNIFGSGYTFDTETNEGGEGENGEGETGEGEGETGEGETSSETGE